jgi:hypothetical protein
MMCLKRALLYRAQSVIEYAIFLAVVLSALLLLQAIVKRGFSGNLREAADKMGQQYSPTVTTSRTVRRMLNDQYINEEINTSRTNEDEGHIGIDRYIPTDFGYTPNYIAEDGVYSYTERLNQKFSTEYRERTDSATKETFRWDDAPATTWEDFPAPF